jgi:hypothetical protein
MLSLLLLTSTTNKDMRFLSTRAYKFIGKNHKLYARIVLNFLERVVIYVVVIALPTAIIVPVIAPMQYFEYIIV